MGFVVSRLENPCQRDFRHARGRPKGKGVGLSCYVGHIPAATSALTHHRGERDPPGLQSARHRGALFLGKDVTVAQSGQLCRDGGARPIRHMHLSLPLFLIGSLRCRSGGSLRALRPQPRKRPSVLFERERDLALLDIQEARPPEGPDGAVEGLHVDAEFLLEFPPRLSHRDGPG